MASCRRSHQPKTHFAESKQNSRSKTTTGRPSTSQIAASSGQGISTTESLLSRNMNWMGGARKRAQHKNDGSVGALFNRRSVKLAVSGRVGPLASDAAAFQGPQRYGVPCSSWCRQSIHVAIFVADFILIHILGGIQALRAVQNVLRQCQLWRQNTFKSLLPKALQCFLPFPGHSFHLSPQKCKETSH